MRRVSSPSPATSDGVRAKNGEPGQPVGWQSPGRGSAARPGEPHRDAPIPGPAASDFSQALSSSPAASVSRARGRRTPTGPRAAGIPDDLRFVTEPARAADMITQAWDAGALAARVTRDEVYGGDPHLSTEPEQRRIGYVSAVSRKRPIATGELAFCRRYSPRPVSLAALSPELGSRATS
ncbi:transposase [Kitasatospora sp. NPDC058048]|uniref:transposase n=1 Tax=Kitasatospora sp. NPDC058048 TaxID=3346313 RepID=UPI0036DB5DA6